MGITEKDILKTVLKVPQLEEQLETIITDTTNKFNGVETKKLDKNGIITMSNLGQDVKEAMTGGSVAVVGTKSVSNINLTDELLKDIKACMVNFVGEISKITIDISKNAFITTKGDCYCMVRDYGTLPIMKMNNLKVKNGAVLCVQTTGKVGDYWEVQVKDKTSLVVGDGFVPILTNVDGVLNGVWNIPQGVYRTRLTEEDNIDIKMYDGLYFFYNATSNPPIGSPIFNEKGFYFENKNFESYALQIAYEWKNPQNAKIRQIHYKTDGTKDFATSWTNYNVINTGESGTKKLIGKKILTMGDSITHQGLYQPHIAQRTGATIVNVGYSGSRYAKRNTPNDTSYNPYSFYEYSKTVDLTDIDMILVAFGTNDYGNMFPIEETETNLGEGYYLRSGIRGGFKHLFERKPTLKIGVILPLYRSYELNTFIDCDTTGTPMCKYVDCIKEECEKARVPYWNGFTECGFNKYNLTTFTTDLLHLNDRGGELVGNRVAEFVNSIFY